MPLDLSDPATIAVLLGLLAFVGYRWLKWRWRIAWFDRVYAEAWSRVREEGRREGAGDDE